MKLQKSKILFDQIDYLMDLPQNIKNYPNIIKLCQDVVYDIDSYRIAKLDVYCHEDYVDKLCPIVVNFHGGGFVAGDKYHRRSYASYLASLGYKVINVNYGLCPEYKFPAFLQHGGKAMFWIKQNAEFYKFDLNNIILSGDSAGAFIALALTICSYNNSYRTAVECIDFNLKIKGVCLLCGAYIPSQAMDKKMIFDINKALCCLVTGLEENELQNYSSYKYYNELDAGKFVDNNFPPTLIIHSLKDIFCNGDAPLVIELFDKHNVPHREICSLTNMHDWQEMQLTKSSKIVLEQIKIFLCDIVNNNISTENNLKLTIKNGKIQ